MTRHGTQGSRANTGATISRGMTVLFVGRRTAAAKQLDQNTKKRVLNAVSHEKSVSTVQMMLEALWYTASTDGAYLCLTVNSGDVSACVK